MAKKPPVAIDTPKPTPLIQENKPTGSRDPFELFGSRKPESAMDKLNRKPSWISQRDVAAPYKWWRKATMAPIGSALAAAGLAGAGAYYAAPWIARKLKEKLPNKVSPEMTEDEIKKMRNRMALLAALGVGGLSLATHFDKRAPVGSMTNWNYIPKKAMLGDFSNAAVMTQDMIPLDHAKEIVANDRFLTSGQKAAIGTIFDNTMDKTGDVSMADITSGAIRSGLGFAGGAVAGYALGKIFALPASVTRAASVTGGLANALRVSGLIS